jgi:hypothetical protein
LNQILPICLGYFAAGELSSMVTIISLELVCEHFKMDEAVPFRRAAIRDKWWEIQPHFAVIAAMIYRWRLAASDDGPYMELMWCFNCHDIIPVRRHLPLFGYHLYRKTIQKIRCENFEY